MVVFKSRRSSSSSESWKIDHLASKKPESFSYLHGDDWDSSTLPSTPSIQKDLVSFGEDDMTADSSHNHQSNAKRKMMELPELPDGFLDYDSLLDVLLSDAPMEEEEDDDDDTFRELVKDAVDATFEQEPFVEESNFKDDISCTAFLEGATSPWRDSENGELQYRLSSLFQKQCYDDISTTESYSDTEGCDVKDIDDKRRREEEDSIASCSVYTHDKEWSFDALFNEQDTSSDDPQSLTTGTTRSDSSNKQRRWSKIMRHLSPFLKKTNQ